MFGAYDPKGGGVEHGPAHLRPARLPAPGPELVGGVCEAEAAALLRRFFLSRR